MNLFIYCFQHDDQPRNWTPCPRPPKAVVEGFLKAGWDSDGIIGYLLLPPWCAITDDTSWVKVFHVKQLNNGISFLASPYPLVGPRLELHVIIKKHSGSKQPTFRPRNTTYPENLNGKCVSV